MKGQAGRLNPWQIRSLLFDKSPGGKQKLFEQNKSGAEASHSRAKELENTDVIPGTSSFRKEQLEHPYKLFQSVQFSQLSSSFCSLAQEGSFLQSVAFNVSTYPACLRITDSGATDHMTNSSRWLFSYHPREGNQKN